jgi:hypothetical protein
MANQFIKRAHAESEYTAEQIQELARCQKDPVYFIRNYVYLQHPTRGKMLFNLYDYQEELVKIVNENKRVVALISRQMGKCFHVETNVNTISKPSWVKMRILKLIDKEEANRVEKLFNLSKRV